MDQTRILIYLLGALVLLFFLAFGLRRTSQSSKPEIVDRPVEPQSPALQESSPPVSVSIQEPIESNQMNKPSVLGFETAPSKERAISDFISKMGREAALNEDKKEGELEDDLQSKIGKQNWSRMVHETFQQRANVSESVVRPSSAYNQHLMVMNIMAPEGFVFLGIDITEVLGYQGFVYIEPGFFNRYDSSNRLQFRVASAIGNGFLPTADLERFETTGISFFMELDKLADPRAAFRQMLTDAHEINYALSGSLRDETGCVLSQQSVARYLAKIKAVEESRDYVNA